MRRAGPVWDAGAAATGASKPAGSATPRLRGVCPHPSRPPPPAHMHATPALPHALLCPLQAATTPLAGAGRSASMWLRSARGRCASFWRPRRPTPRSSRCRDGCLLACGAAPWCLRWQPVMDARLPLCPPNPSCCCCTRGPPPETPPAIRPARRPPGCTSSKPTFCLCARWRRRGPLRAVCAPWPTSTATSTQRPRCCRFDPNRAAGAGGRGKPHVCTCWPALLRATAAIAAAVPAAALA